MLDDLLVKINVDLSPLMAAAPKIETNMNTMRTSINRINTTPIVVVPGQVVSALETIEIAAHGVESTMDAAAFSASLTSGALSRLSSVATVSGNAFSALDKTATLAMGSISSVATSAGIVAPALDRSARFADKLSKSFQAIANGARIVGGTAGTLSGGLKSLTAGVLHVVHSIHAAQIVVDLLSTAFTMLMVPIRIVGTLAMTVFRGLALVMNTVLLPVKWLFKGIAALAGAFGSLISAVSSVAITVFKVWFIFKGWIGTIKILGQWLGMLPPKMRVIVGGLILLGASGKVGAFALNLLAKGAKVAIFAFQALSLPLLALTNPMAALRSAAMLLGQSLLAAGNMAIWAGASFYAMGASVVSAVGSVASSIGGKLLSVLKTGVTGFAVLTGAAAAWGIKLASKAETATIVFGTMLKDMTAGKALMNELEGWSGAPLFDPDAIQLSGTLLFKAGIAADQITGKLDQLGNIAAATKTPLDDLSKIYQQGMNQGAFQQDKINQLSDRGIAIYEGLAFATGKSGQALKEMIRDGKIGPTEMNAAIEHLTTGTGIYAGAMENLAQSSGGMWSGMMNKAGMAAREFGINIMTAIDAKGLMTSATTFFTNLKSQIANAMPAFSAIATVVRAAFSAVWEIVTVVFSSITGAMGVTSENWMTTFLEWSAIATWAFEQWPDIMTLAFVNTQLSLVRTGNDFAHFFTGVMPNLLTWFGSEWQNVFTDIGNVTLTIFENISKNIAAVMTGVWDYLKSGGTKSMEIAFVPLMTGFESTIKTLPNIPTRAVTELERQLQADSERLGESLGGSLQQKIDANMQMLDKFKADQAAYVAPTLDGAHGPGNTNTGDEPPAGGGNKRTSFAIDSLDKGSEAALKAVFANQREDKAGQQQVAEQKQTNKHLAKLVARKDGPAIAVQGAV